VVRDSIQICRNYRTRAKPACPVLAQPARLTGWQGWQHASCIRSTRRNAHLQSGRTVAAEARDSGFTLLEILVVIVIIAILAGFVTVNLDLRNTPKTIRDEAQRLGFLMQIASEQAVYAKAQLGVRFHPEDYEFYFLGADEEGAQSWQILDDERLRFRESNEEIEFQVDISGVPILLETLEDERAALTEEDPEIKPHIMFLSNGEIMPDFAITVADSEARFRHQVYTGVDLPVVVEQLE